MITLTACGLGAGQRRNPGIPDVANGHPNKTLGAVAHATPAACRIRASMSSTSIQWASVQFDTFALMARVTLGQRGLAIARDVA